MATRLLKQYCLVCKDVAHFECACCNGHTPYCSKACQRADYASLHKFESSFFSASTSGQEGRASRKEEPLKKGAPETKASMEDRWIRAEFHRIAKEVEETYNEWKREPAPKSSLDELTSAQREAVMTSLFANFNNQTVNEDRARERKRYTAQLERMGEGLAEHIPMKDGSKRRVIKLDETAQLREGLARFFRMNDLATEKQKLVFMRNSEKDREEYTEWLLHTESYQKRFILYWLFADDGITYEALQQRIIEEERRSLGVAVAEESLRHYKEEARALLIDYLVETDEEEEELLFHGLTPVKRGPGRPRKDGTFKGMMQTISEVIDSEPGTDFTAKAVEFMGSLQAQAEANEEANYTNDTTTADQRDTGLAYVRGLFSTVIERFKSDVDSDEGEWAKLKREVEERVGVPLKTMRKAFSQRTIVYFNLTVVLACLGGFFLGKYSHIHYSITPALQTVIDKLTTVKDSISSRLFHTEHHMKDLESTSASFQEFATGVKQKASSITTMSRADLTDPGVVSLLKNNVRTLLADIDRELLNKATDESTEYLNMAYSSLRDTHIKNFLETPDTSLAKNSLDAIVVFLNKNQGFLKSINIDTTKFTNHVDTMSMYFKRAFGNVKETVKDLRAAETIIETINKQDMPAIIQQANDDDFNAGCTRAFMRWIGKAHLLTGSAASHAFDSFVTGNSTNLPGMWARGALDMAVMFELKAKNYYRACASGDFTKMLPFITSLFTGQIDIMIILSTVVSAVSLVTYFIPTSAIGSFARFVPNWLYNASSFVQGVNLDKEERGFADLKARLGHEPEEVLKTILSEERITIREYFRLLLPDASMNDINVKVALNNYEKGRETTEPLHYLIRSMMLIGVTTRFANLLWTFYAMASTCAVTVLMSATNGLLGDTFVTGASILAVPVWVYVVYKYNKEATPDKSFIMKSLGPITTLYDFYRTWMIPIEMGLGIFEVVTGLAPIPLFSNSVISENKTIDQPSPVNDSYIRAVNHSTVWGGMKEKYADMNVNILAKNTLISDAIAYLKEGHFLDIFTMEAKVGGNHT